MPEIGFPDYFERFDAVVRDVDDATCALELCLDDALVDGVVFDEEDVHLVEIWSGEGDGCQRLRVVANWRRRREEVSRASEW